MAAHDLEDGEEITGINVTPLVDVMLVLLVIFMVTANYISQNALNLELPKAATGEASSNEVNLGFALDEASQLYLDGEAVSYAEVKKRIDEEKSAGKKLQALISADQKTPHGAVIKLMDEVRKHGVTDIAFNVEVEVQASPNP